MKIYKKKWLLEIRRLSGIQYHTQRKRRNTGRCYYRWRTYRKAFDKFIMFYHNSLIELYEYITAIGYDKVLYSDTDSIFYIKDPEVEKRIAELNQRPHTEYVEGHEIITAGGCIIKKLEEKTISDWEYGAIDFEDFESEVTN